MKYNFDKLTNRFNTNSLKWDVKEEELPMWVADMDFEVAPCITDSIIKRTQNKIFGYNIIPLEWNNAIISWWERRHNYKIESDWLLFSTGVVPTISSMVRKLTSIGDNIVIQTPVYNIFFNSILNNQRVALESPLVYKNNTYSIDFNDLEEKLSNPLTTMMILCNPHNPIGKIWDKETLEKIGDLCNKYNVVVISDEIHCDITDPGKEYIPFQSVNEICKNISLTCIAPTKCFNMAGMQTSAIIVPNEELRKKVFRGINNDEIAEPNSFAINACIEAFNNGEEWLEELREYIYKNKLFTTKFIEEKLKEIKLISSNATYLLWIDCENICDNTDELVEFIKEKTGLVVSTGSQYGKTGIKFIRLNIACAKERLIDGLNRLKKGIFQYINQKK